ncbi:hypothetical protein OQA88_8368 [Cercophora sp. LCS_1]
MRKGSSMDISVGPIVEAGPLSLERNCAVCFPLTTCNEERVIREALVASERDGCPTCRFFSIAIAQADDNLKGETKDWKHVSAWSDNGVMGLCINSDEEKNDAVVAVAANGSEDVSPM